MNLTFRADHPAEFESLEVSISMKPKKVVPDKPIATPPTGFFPSAVQREILVGELRAAGLELGDHDRRIVGWLAETDWSTVATIASWVKRANR